MSCYLWLMIVWWLHGDVIYQPLDRPMVGSTVNHFSGWVDHERRLGRSREP